jgi:hypothetical protein
MSCDFFIDKNLYIHYKNDNNFSFINLERIKEYYYDITYEDYHEYDYETYEKNFFTFEDNDYEKRCKKLIEYQLKPKMKPIVIYNKGRFNKFIFEKKYKKKIEYEIKIRNKEWDDIKKIMKIEERYENI